MAAQTETTGDTDPNSFARPTETVLQSLQDLWVDFLDHVPLMLGGVLAIVATWIVVAVTRAILRRVLERASFGRSLTDLFTQLTSTAIWVAGILVATIIVFPGMTPAKVLAVLGLGSVAIGFAFKDIFENFFAGILILWRFPFDPGDYVECGDVAGEIVHTSIRMTTVRQVSGELVTVPNGMLFKNPVRVLTNRPVRRVTIDCGVAYGANVDEARDVITRAVESCGTISGDHPVQVFAKAFGASSIDFEVTWWTGSTPLDRRRSRDEVVAAVKGALDDAGIEIPFPHRTMTFASAVPVEMSREEGVLANAES